MPPPTRAIRTFRFSGIMETQGDSFQIHIEGVLNAKENKDKIFERLLGRYYHMLTPVDKSECRQRLDAGLSTELDKSCMLSPDVAVTLDYFDHFFFSVPRIVLLLHTNTKTWIPSSNPMPAAALPCRQIEQRLNTISIFLEVISPDHSHPCYAHFSFAPTLPLGHFTSQRPATIVVWGIHRILLPSELTKCKIN